MHLRPCFMMTKFRRRPHRPTSGFFYQNVSEKPAAAHTIPHSGFFTKAFPKKIAATEIRGGQSFFTNLHRIPLMVEGNRSPSHFVSFHRKNANSRASSSVPSFWKCRRKHPSC